MPSVTLAQLQSHLWEAANILRGPVDAADFKSYVFPLLFFKRLSDVHDEEHAAALKEFEGDEESALFPENYGFQISEGCHWRDVRKVASNVGQALQTALRGIEQANPHTLYGILPFLMMSDRLMNRAVEISVGSLSPTINWTTLKRETFALPPLDKSPKHR
jgi:type I restriction-modification system DNA methylase subunit